MPGAARASSSTRCRSTPSIDGSGFAAGSALPRAERPPLAARLVVGVPKDAAGVAREQVDRHGGDGGGRAHAVDVVARRQQAVEVPRLERAPADEIESIPSSLLEAVDLLVLRAAVEPDQPP